MRKKLLLAALSVFTVCAMTACGKEDDDKTEAVTTAATTAAVTTEAPTEAPTTEAPTTEAPTEAPSTEEPASEEEDEENYETGDASLDNPRNADEIGENEILVVSFGTSYNDSRRLTIGAIEEAIEKAYPDWSVRRAFTSDIIINHIKNRDGEVIDSLDEALERAEKNGVKNLVIQPTHLMNGYEYEDVLKALAKHEGFETVTIGDTLLAKDEYFERVAKILADTMSKYDDGETAICFMGHGTEHESNAVYAKMQETFKNLGYENFYVGTVEAEPSFQDVVDTVAAAGKYKKVVLRPLMVVAGDHANNDMAGDEDDTWKSLFVNAGFEVETDISGLGELEEIQKMYVEFAGNSIKSIAK